MSKVVRYETYSGVAQITLMAPQTGNALTSDLVSQLHQFLQQSLNDESCRVITISAEGSDFCKGLDLESVLIENESSNSKFFKIFLDCLICICNSSRPVIACVEGNVTGGGLGLVAACDLVLAVENITFMLPEVILGIFPALITPFLLRRLTPARLKYLTLSTRQIKSLEAKEFGLVDEVVTEEMSQVLNRQLQRLLRASPNAIAKSKQYFEQMSFVDLNQHTEIALSQLTLWLEQPEVLESFKNFVQGFSPSWFQKYRRY